MPSLPPEHRGLYRTDRYRTAGRHPQCRSFGEQCTCPKCRKSRILFFDKVAKCADVDCSFTLFRNKGGDLTDGQIIELATKGRTPLVKGFKSREGKSFDAALVLNPDFTIGYSFPDRKPQEKKSGRKK